MKKFMFIVMAAMSLSFAACTSKNDTPTVDVVEADSTEVVVDTVTVDTVAVDTVVVAE